MEVKYDVCMPGSKTYQVPVPRMLLQSSPCTSQELIQMHTTSVTFPWEEGNDELISVGSSLKNIYNMSDGLQIADQNNVPVACAICNRVPPLCRSASRLGLQITDCGCENV
jgi:hypothetical protein